MNQHYVYLHLPTNRLIITAIVIYDEDYHELMNNSGNNNMGLAFCKVYCIGYIQGVGIGIKPINDLREFQ